MHAPRAILLGLTLLGLAGCHKYATAEFGGAHPHGRYAGIGLFEPSKLWAKVQGDDSKDPAAAKLEDDEIVIVVVDSETGEVRECGNYSGRCLSMNPWTKAVGPQQHTPVRVDAHAAELASEGTSENVFDNATEPLESAKPASTKHR